MPRERPVALREEVAYPQSYLVAEASISSILDAARWGIRRVLLGREESVDTVIALEREWETLARSRLRLELQSWAASERALVHFESPDRLIRFLWDKRASPAEKDQILAALLRLVRTESSAGRVVLQAMLPGLKALAGVLLKRDPDHEGEPALEREELWQVLLVSMLERIKTYPLARRPGRIAANLVLDVKHATLAELQRARNGYRELPRDEPLEPVEDSSAWLAEDVEEPLRQAVATGAISETDADLIAWVDVDGMAVREAAERLGISYNAAKIRRQKAKRRLLMFLRPWTQNLYVETDPKGASDRPSSGAYAPEALEDTAEQAG